MNDNIRTQSIEYFRKNGYLLIEDALSDFDLDRVRAAYQSVQPDAVASGKYRGGNEERVQATSVILTGTDPLTAGTAAFDDIFLDIANNQRLVPLLREIVGENLQSIEILAHCHQAHTEAHTGWHRDWSPWTHPRFTLKAKVFYFLDDLTEFMGCLALVPGSHKWPDPPPAAQYEGAGLTLMPGLTKMTGFAGSAVIWDALCWHTALPNESDRDRRTLVYGYAPFWVKKWGSRMPPDHVVRWSDTMEKRQLMGIHSAVGRSSWDITGVPYLPGHNAKTSIQPGGEYIGNRTDRERRFRYLGNRQFEELTDS